MDRPGGWRPPVERLGLVQILRQCWRELRKVAWPTRRAVAHNAAILLGVVVVLVVVLGALDIGLARVLPTAYPG
jgi:preprotein translocase SecE subunit